MATGSMSAAVRKKVTRHSTLLAVGLCLVSGLAGAQDVGLAGVLGSKAMLMINGGEPQSVAVGQSLEGVRVVSASMRSAPPRRTARAKSP